MCSGRRDRVWKNVLRGQLIVSRSIAKVEQEQRVSESVCV